MTNTFLYLERKANVLTMIHQTEKSIIWKDEAVITNKDWTKVPAITVMLKNLFKGVYKNTTIVIKKDAPSVRFLLMMLDKDKPEYATVLIREREYQIQIKEEDPKTYKISPNKRRVGDVYKFFSTRHKIDKP
jgi:hypothetical protein